MSPRPAQATAAKVREKAFLYKVEFYVLPTRDELVEMLEDCARKLAEYEDALWKIHRVLNDNSHSAVDVVPRSLISKALDAALPGSDPEVLA